jgi:hypothetical protein
MALVGTFTGYAFAYALRRLASRSRTGLLVTSFVAAPVNTVVAALAFVLEYAIGGAVAAVRPDLVYLLRGRPPRGHRAHPGRGRAMTAPRSRFLLGLPARRGHP